jgi:hypothetical protein
VLMIHFLRFHSPTESTFAVEVPPRLPGLNLEPV